MSLDTVSDFLEAIDRAGELHRITAPVKVHLEITEIADRVSKMPGGGKALLFEHPVLRDGTRSPYPVAINLFGSMRRMALAKGTLEADASDDIVMLSPRRCDFIRNRTIFQLASGSAAGIRSS